MQSPPSLVESMRRDTLQSLKKFATIREKLARGNLNVSSWSSTEIKKKFTLERIRDAFETEAIYALFFERDREGLRDRLAVVERELRLGKEDSEKLENEKIEILVALKNLGERMTEEEKLTMREGLERGVMEDLEMLMEDV
jgi:septum formation topological specificity factor MinE